MKRLKEAALVAEVVGGLGVIISLVFVGLQVRENAMLLEAQAVFDLREVNAQLVRDLTSNAELSEMLFRGYANHEALSDIERWRFDLWVHQVFSSHAIAWKYGEQGLLEAEEFAAWQGATCLFLAYPGARVVWDQGGSFLSETFRRDVTEKCSDAATTGGASSR